MDASHSPTPPEGGQEPGQDAGSDGEDGSSGKPAQPRRRTSLIKSLLQRAAGLGRPSDQGENGWESDDALGPAFEESSPAELAMVMNILRLRELRVEDVMTPRADIAAVPVDASLEEVMAALSRGSLSRVPVYQETLDDPLGFVHLKDLALTYGVGCAKQNGEFDLREHLRQALFVPASMRIAALMQRMQASRVHMALVIDEFGGVDGLVTIEDLVEQIVGDIEDEHDTEEHAQWRSEAPGVYLVNARADIREFCEAEGVELLPEDWEEEVDTLGGMVFMLTGRVPTRGEVIAHPTGHEFEVIDADPRRIRRMRLTLRDALTPAARPPARQAAE